MSRAEEGRRSNEGARRRRRAAQAEELQQIIVLSVDSSFFSRALTLQKRFTVSESLCAHMAALKNPQVPRRTVLLRGDVLRAQTRREQS